MMTKVSIIIPTFNRPGYLRRVLGYYDSFDRQFDVIVADSSSDENKNLNKEVIASFPKLGIIYLGDYPSEINGYAKIFDAVNHVATEYCVFCADDDFITPKGIKKSVEFLETHQDFVLAQGHGIGFTVKKNRENKQEFHWKYAYLPVSVELTDPAARLEYHLSKYLITTFYGVHRSDTLKIVYNFILKCEADLFLFGELLATSLTLLIGKIKCLDVLYAARDATPVTANRGPSIKSSIEAGTFEREYTKFRDCLLPQLVEKSRLNPKEAGDLIDKAMSAYLHSRGLTPLVPNPKTKKGALLDSLHLPLRIQNGIIASYVFLNKVATVKAKSLYEALVSKPIFSLIKNSDDFAKIRRHVLSEPGTN
jgi:glycosyltransferase domain-containing protein